MKTFEEKLNQLESISKDLQQGDLGIETSMSYFEDGIKLAKELAQKLENMEQRIEILINTGELQSAPPTENETKPQFELFDL